MKRALMTFGVIAALVVALAIMFQLQPAKLTPERVEASERAADQLARAEETEARIIEEADQATVQIAQNAEDNDGDESMRVKFETSTGDFVAEFYEAWAPLGYGRIKEMIEQDVLDDAHFFRVVPNFVIQFGIPGDPEVAAQWRGDTIKDDPVEETNSRGTITFATSGKDSRTTQLFINLGDNTRLDGMGFSPVGKIVEGMAVVDDIESKYREMPDQGSIQSRGNEYLKENFPDLDYIKNATILEPEE